MVNEQSTVYVVDDDEAVRDSLCRLFQSVGLPAKAYPSGEAFLSSYNDGSAGCLVIDMRMPGMNGFDVQQELSVRGTNLPMVFITGHADVQAGVRAMKAGALDFIEKPISNQAILDLVHGAIAKNREHLEHYKSIKQDQDLYDQLTPREREVLGLIVDGELNKRIAHILTLSEKTVEFHRANIMRKMQAQSLADLIKKALNVLPL